MVQLIFILQNGIACKYFNKSNILKRGDNVKELYIRLNNNEYKVKWIDFSNEYCKYYDGTMWRNTDLPSVGEVDLSETEYELILK